MRRQQILFVIALACVSVSLSGCRAEKKKSAGKGAKSAEAGPAEPAAPKTATAVGKPYQLVVNLPGATISGFETTQIRAKVGGYVRAIGKVGEEYIDIGSRVTEGMLLAELDIPETVDLLREKQALVQQARSAVLQAHAQVDEARARVLQRTAELEQVRAQRAEKEAALALNEKKLKRLSGLRSSGVIEADALDEVEFSVAAARAALKSMGANEKAAATNIRAAEAAVARAEADEKAAEAEIEVAVAAAERVKTMMGYSRLKSPFAGVVTRRMVDHGSFVQPADNNSAAMPLFEVTRMDRVRVTVGVPNTKLDRIAPGQDARLHTIGGLPGRSFNASVTRMSATLDAKSRTMHIEVDFTNPVRDANSEDEIELRPGMFGTLTVVCQEWTDENPLAVVPTSAVSTDSDGRDFVVLVDGDKRTKSIVDVQFNDAINIGVSTGLKVGQTVATEGLARFK